MQARIGTKLQTRGKAKESRATICAGDLNSKRSRPGPRNVEDAKNSPTKSRARQFLSQPPSASFSDCFSADASKFIFFN